MSSTKSKKKAAVPETLDYEQQSALSGWIRIKDSRVRFSPAEAAKILVIRDSLKADKVRLEDGTPVETVYDTIRYVISQVKVEE